MDAPYSSSGALSTTQYTLVRKVENTLNDEDAETLFVDEVADVKKRLSGNLSLVRCNNVAYIT